MNTTNDLSGNIAQVAAFLADQVTQEQAWLRTNRAVVTAPYADSLTPVLRRVGHPTVYFIFSLSGEMYAAHRHILAGLGMELLRDELLLSYRGRAMNGARAITVTQAGARMVANATREFLICELWEGQAAADGDYGPRWIGVDGDDPMHPGQSLDIVDAYEFGDCECGSTLIGNLKAMICPSCGRITWGT